MSEYLQYGTMHLNRLQIFYLYQALIFMQH